MRARARLLQAGAVIVVLAILAGAAALIGTLQPKPPLAQNAEVPAVTSSFTYAPGNIQFDPAGGWVLATNTVALPEGMGGVQFALRKLGTPCVFAYARMTRAEREAYVQTSFAERIFSGPNNANQFDSSWYIRSDHTPEGFAFDWDARQRFPGEVRIIPPGYLGRWEYEGHLRAFLLYDEDGTTVPDACNADVNAMLATMLEYYPEAHIDHATTGSLYVKDSKVLLLGADDIARIVYQLPGGSTEHTIAGNALYYRAGTVLHRLDIFSKSDVIVAVPSLSQDANRSFIVSHGSVFSLSDGVCSLDVPCPQRLYDTELKSGNTAYLADVNANTVMGYSTTDQAVYVEWARGDAGCTSVSVSRYSIIYGVIEPVRTLNACDGDAHFNDSSAEYAALRAHVDGAMRSLTHIELRDGALVVPSGDTFADPGALPLFLAL